MMVWCGVPTLCITNCSVLRASQRRGKSIFIPWRDSKLTRVLQVARAHGDRFVDVHGHTSPERFVALQRALGTNARLRVIINISPADSSNSETVGSLLFGQRALTMTVAPVRVHGMPSVTCAAHLGGRCTFARPSTRRRTTKPCASCCRNSWTSSWIANANKTGTQLCHHRCTAATKPWSISPHRAAA